MLHWWWWWWWWWLLLRRHCAVRRGRRNRRRCSHHRLLAPSFFAAATAGFTSISKQTPLPLSSGQSLGDLGVRPAQGGHVGGIWRAWQPAGFQPSSHAQLLAAPHTWAASFNWRNCGCCALWVHAVRVVRAIWRPAGRAHVVDGQCGVAGQCGAAVIGRRGGFGRAGKHSPGKIPEKCRVGVAVNSLPPALSRVKKLRLEHLKGGGGRQA